VLALQRGAGNQAVARLLSRAPVDLDPGRFFEQHPEMVEGKKKKPEHATRSDATSYESQPEALREVIERSQNEAASSWFARLSDEARSTSASRCTSPIRPRPARPHPRSSSSGMPGVQRTVPSVRIVIAS
jgi:hypothetical protein